MVILRGNITISDDYVITTQSSIEEPKESLGWTMYRNMLNHKDKLAQICAKTGEKDTFGQLLIRSIRTALHLKDKNITRDDIVALCSKNHLDTVVPYLASQFLGVKVASLDPSFSDQEMVYLIKQVSPKILFATPESVETIEKILKNLSITCELVVFGHTNKHTEYSEFLEAHQDENKFKPVKIDNLKDTAVIHFSSGTTGMPKGICLSHYSFVGQSLNFTQTENPDYEYMKKQASRVSFPLIQVGYTSLYWVSAGTMLLSSIIQGFCRLVCDDFDPNEIWELIRKYKPIVLILTPIQAMEMLGEYRSDVDVSSILSIITMGAPISKEYSIKLQKAFPEADVTRGYGQTEVCGILTNFRGNDLFHRPLMKEKIESIGLPIRGVSYKVVDVETNKNLGPNCRGELRVKSQFIMNGYHNLSCSGAFDEHGWLKTGDIVYYDKDYCFYIIDRIRESFKYKGWFISPTYLESILLAHPAVEQAVVIGVPKEDGYHPMGLVILRNKCNISENEIEKFVEDKVPERQKLRAGVKFIKSIPLTVTGKVKRQEITKIVLKELGYSSH